MFLFCAPTKLKITFLFLNQKLPEVVEFLRYFAALFAHQGKQILRLTPSPVSTKNKKQESWNNPPKFWDLNDAWLKDHHVDIRRRKKVIEPQRLNCQRDMFVFLLSIPLCFLCILKWRHRESWSFHTHEVGVVAKEQNRNLIINIPRYGHQQLHYLKHFQTRRVHTWFAPN